MQRICLSGGPLSSLSCPIDVQVKLDQEMFVDRIISGRTH